MFGSDVCVVCDSKTKSRGSSKTVACEKCRSDAVGGLSLAFYRLQSAQARSLALQRVCEGCKGERDTGFGVDTKGWGVRVPLADCLNTSCEVFYRRLVGEAKRREERSRARSEAK